MIDTGWRGLDERPRVLIRNLLPGGRDEHLRLRADRGISKPEVAFLHTLAVIVGEGTSPPGAMAAAYYRLGDERVRALLGIA
jgi:hypothetical protein